MTRNKRVRLIALAAVSAIGSIAFLPARSHANAEVSGNASPRSLYLQNCARCHGADGKAQTKLGQSLGADDISGGEGTAKVIRTVTNGRGEMPSFKGRLSPAQIRAIASYVQKLK